MQPRIQLRRFGCKEDVLDTLNHAIQMEVQRAHQKSIQSWYWGEVGTIEHQAAMQAQARVQAIASATNPWRFFMTSAGLARRCHAALMDLADAWRAKPEDADGYGLSTMHAIRRVLER